MSQYWIAYHVTILFGVLLVLECVWLPETLFPRSLVVASEQGNIPGKDEGVSFNVSAASIKKTRDLGFLNFRKVPGLKHPKPYVTAAQFCMVWTYPTIVVSTLAYVFFHYWW